jgi:acetolactate synthase I/II/III large subunit
VNGADLFVKCLEREGVEYVFGLPGEEIADLLRALGESKNIKFVLARQEQGAAFMADVYGRLTGKPGVCLSTLGPGATNLLTGVVDAYLDRAPLVAITGQGGLARNYEESHQYIDIVSVYKFVTKWNRSVTRAEFIPHVIRKAFSVAQQEKTGAVHIELPEDVAGEKIDLRSNPPISANLEKTRATVSREAARSAAKLIERSRCPVVLAGNGAIREGASRELTEFAEAFQTPVVNTFMGKGVLSSRSPFSIGAFGLQTKDLVNCIFEKSDLAICVGYDFVEQHPEFWNSHEAKIPVLHIDSMHAETDRNYPVVFELVGNIGRTLTAIIAEKETTKSDANRSQCARYATRVKDRIEAELTRFARDDSFPVKPQRLILEIRKALSDEDILISDVGMHKTWISRLYPAYSPNTVIISNGFASMGIALPGAIAAKLAKPERKVVAACGDGGFLMTVYDLMTAKDLGLALTVVIFDDGIYGQIKWKQDSKFGRSYFAKFSNPDFVKLAQGFGCKVAKVRSTRELKTTLRTATNSKEVWVVDVPIDARENARLSGRLGENVHCP